MSNLYQPAHQVNTALFVDFDNIYLSLESQDLEAAQTFASNPERWLQWLERELPLPGPSGWVAGRRTIIRRCYFNPQTFGHARPYFIRSAFEVIGCPPLTRQGKTSTDINMVMDVLEALNNSAAIEEFILLSGDADFTPLLLRLRRHARYTAVLSVGYVSPAYKSACDYLINQDAFIQSGLGIRDYDSEEEPHPSLPDRSLAALLARMAERLANDATSNPGGLSASELPSVYKEFSEFRQSSHWLGFFSLRNLTEALVGLRNDLNIV
jgi:hypothetical protein